MIEVALPAQLERFIVRTPSCWFWVASLSADGYATMQLGRGATLRTIRVHRYVCQLQWGPLDPIQKALHTCDETSCVRPRDLYPGTQATNLAQMVRRGRSAGDTTRAWPTCAAPEGGLERSARHCATATTPAPSRPRCSPATHAATSCSSSKFLRANIVGLTP